MFNGVDEEMTFKQHKSMEEHLDRLIFYRIRRDQGLYACAYINNIMKYGHDWKEEAYIGKDEPSGLIMAISLCGKDDIQIGHFINFKENK